MVRDGKICDKQLKEAFTRDAAAAYLISEHSDEFEAGIKIESVKDRLGRSPVWKERNTVWQDITGRKPRGMVEVFGEQAFDKDTKKLDGVSEVDPGKEEFEEPIENFLISFQDRAAAEGVPRQKYLSMVSKLKPKHVAEELQKQERFKKMEISTITNRVVRSQAWANRQLTLNEDWYGQ